MSILKVAKLRFRLLTGWHLPTLEPRQGNTFSIFVIGGTYKELKTVFDKLSEGADKDKRTFIEIHNMPFGSYGQFTDKYGVSWIFKGEKKE